MVKSYNIYYNGDFIQSSIACSHKAAKTQVIELIESKKIWPGLTLIEKIVLKNRHLVTTKLRKDK
jgi:hypothetical protein